MWNISAAAELAYLGSHMSRKKLPDLAVPLPLHKRAGLKGYCTR
jgi:hypothetical protein